MARRLHLTTAAVGLWALSGAAWASGDYGCSVSWKLFDTNRDCADRAVIAPSNDTRVNLLFLLRDHAGLGTAGLSYPKQDWDNEGFGHTFFDWDQLRASLYPAKPNAAEVKSPDYAGSRCASLASGTPAFVAAMAAARGLPAAERDGLTAARGRLDKVCANGAEARYAVYRRNSGEAPTAQPSLPEWPTVIDSAPGKAFLAYLQASDAFYGERWGEARFSFARLVKSSEPWVAETASYMLSRVEMNAALAKAFDEYGSFDGLDKVDKEAVGRADAALAAYLKTYPQGRYTASAQGLKRRTLWLAGNSDALAREYVRMLGAVPGGDEQAAQLVEEIDSRLLFPFGEQNPGAAQGPLLLAIQDLANMRYDRPDEGADGASGSSPKLTSADIAAQQASFAGQPELYSFLQASHAFHVAHDMKMVLQLIPDDAKRPAYNPLAFSRQMLRGMALAGLGDRNEAGFWLDLLKGATGLWQRPTVELALAMNYERHGKLAAVFAKDSPIADSDIRMILLSNSAGPDLLRAQAQDRTRPAAERNVALYTLLEKQLSRSDYAGFVTNIEIVVPRMEGEGAGLGWNSSQRLPSFAKGRWSDGYPCPAVIETARTLARNPQDIPARLCLGDFWRLNDFYMGEGQLTRPAKDELGGAVNGFPGKQIARGPIYASVIADPRASANDKAYALYRAVNCYGPSGYNDCGGSDVEQPQRRAWFQQLKRDYPASPWARKQRIFW